MKHETKTGRKLLSVLLALAMVLGLMPGMGLTAYAADGQITVTWRGAELPTSACTANGIRITGHMSNHDWSSDTMFYAPSGMVFTGISIDYRDWKTGTSTTWNWSGRAAEVSIGETRDEVSKATFTLERNTVAVTGVNLNPTSATLTVGGTETLTATVAPDNATDKTVAWASSDTSVATVENGVVTAVAAGTAIITATSNADRTKSASCAVRVTTAPGTQYNPWQIGMTKNDNVTAWLSGDGDALTLNISGTGDMQDFADDNPVPWAGSKAGIQTVTIGAGVTSIGDYAFAGCASLTSVTIPDTVRSIGESAFDSCCYNLTSVELPSGVTEIKPFAFMFCTSLTSVTIPGTVTVIGTGAFTYCESLTSVTIPSSVREIGEYAFAGCEGLETVTFTPGTEEAELAIGDCAFDGVDATLAYGTGNTVLYNGDNMVAAETPMSNLGGKNLTWTAAPTDSETPLTLEAKTDGTILVQEPKDGMQYSLNGGERHAVPDEAITVTAGDKVAFYGSATSYSGTVISGGTAQCYIYGNIMSLIDPTGFATAKALGAYAFAHFFEGNARLFSHPDKKLVLPATTLARNCYDSMFYRCAGLTTAPALPATTLAERCYAYMFCECTGLTTAPALPATTLVKECYTNMFAGCTKLNAVTCLAKDISAKNATANWLAGVAQTGTFTKDPTMTGWPTGASGIPAGWNKGTAVTNVILNQTEAQTVAGDGSVALTATVVPGDAADNTVKWSVGGTDPDAVKLYADEACETEIGANATDKLTVYAKGISAGSATVTCTSNGDSTKTASCEVTVNASTYSVTVTPGSNMTKTEASGAASQTGLPGAMADVVYTADEGYYFPEDYSVEAVNGITVTRNSYAQITVSGTPTADAAITLTAPTAKTTPAVSDFTYIAPSNLGYDGNTKTATVISNSDGMGNVTVKYYSDEARNTEATPVNAGTYYVGVTTGSGSNYKATEAVLYHDAWCFTINKATPRKEDFKFSEPSDNTYNGEAKEATVTTMPGVTGMGQVTVKYYDDYHNEVDQAINAGMYRVGVMVSEGDNYLATPDAPEGWSWSFMISKAFPSNENFDVTPPADLTYDGNPKAAAATVRNGITGMGSVTVKYKNDSFEYVEEPTDVGTYNIVLEVAGGTNYHSGTVDDGSWWFTIGKTDPAAENFTFAPPADLTYDGNPKSASVTVKNSVNGMGQATVKYYSDANCTTEANPVNVGTYYVGVTVDDGSNYNAASVVISDPNWHFSIAKAAPKAEHFTCSTPTDLVYDGTKKSVTIAVKDGVVGMGDVTVKYYSDADCENEANPVNVGTYCVGITVDGGSNYNGASVISDPNWRFSITKAEPKAEHFTYTTPTDLVYDGTEKSVTIAVKDGVVGMGDVTVKYYSDADCENEANPVNVGTYYVGVTVDDGSNYNAASVVISDPNWHFSIAKAAPKAEHFTCSTPTDLVYDGTEKSVTIAVKDGVVGMGDVTVKYYSDADCENEANPVNVGTYYVGITVDGGSNYNTASVISDPNWRFSITKAEPKAEHFTYTTPTDLTYDGSAKSAAVTAKNGINGMGDVTVQYYSDAQRTIPATPTDVGTYYVGVAVSEGDNYKAAVVYDAAWQFTISKIDPETGNFTYTAPSDLTYDGSAKSATVTAKDDVNGMGDVTVKYYSDAACENEVEPTDAGTYYVGITVAQGKNYNATDTDLRDPSWSFTVVRLDPTADDFAFATPTDLTYDGNAKSATVTAKDGINGMGDVTVNYYSDAQRTTPATPTDVGTYYVGITVAQGKNYNATDTDLHNEGWQFAIAKADIHPTVSMKNWTEGYRASEPVLEGNPGQGDVTFTYAKQGKDDFTEKKPTSAGRYIVKATVAETANYNGGEATAEFTINADDSADLTVTSPLTSVSRVTINGRVVSPANYTVAGGNVYFTDAFLASLKPGTYTIKVTDGTKTATATYRVENGGIVGSVVLSATTGDPGVVLYAALAVSATLGLGYMGKKRKED